MDTKDVTKDVSYYEVRGNQRQFTKYAVALRAVALLEEGDSILIDAGTSLTPIAKLIRRMADTTTKETHYTVMTHNNEAFNTLSDTPPHARFNVFQTGGRYDRDLNASFGHQAEMAYLRFHPRWVFIGQNGLEADLGLFCHGNTEELALKREIFAMPAWGRVVIADFTKIGKPGGLLFGDSSNLITNVDQCFIISDDIHDKNFMKFFSTDEERSRAIERFEIQLRALQETYRVNVELVHYIVMEVKDQERNRLGKPDGFSDEDHLASRNFRVYCVDSETEQQEDEKDVDNKAWGYVDISLLQSDVSTTVNVTNVCFAKKPLVNSRGIKGYANNAD